MEDQKPPMNINLIYCTNNHKNFINKETKQETHYPYLHISATKKGGKKNQVVFF